MGRKITPPGYHIVDQGDWLSKLARWYGFPRWEPIWEHAKNSRLRAKRKSPNVLFPGDAVYIPAVEPKTIAGSTERRHRFRVRSQGIVYKTTLFDGEGQPRPNTPYKLVVGDMVHEGETNDQGILEHQIPMATETVELQVDGESIRIRVGHLDPIEEVSGVQARLVNLGYDPGPIDDTEGPRTRAAVEAFQRDYDLTVDGICGPQTRKKLEEVYGC